MPEEPTSEPKHFTPTRIIEVKQFLLKLMGERVQEAKALGKAGAVEDGHILLHEAEKLRDAYDLIMFAKRPDA